MGYLKKNIILQCISLLLLKVIFKPRSATTNYIIWGNYNVKKEKVMKCVTEFLFLMLYSGRMR